MDLLCAGIVFCILTVVLVCFIGICVRGIRMSRVVRGGRLCRLVRRRGGMFTVFLLFRNTGIICGLGIRRSGLLFGGILPICPIVGDCLIFFFVPICQFMHSTI